jgi:NitT/TauT family transport system substrate-binding protein
LKRGAGHEDLTMKTRVALFILLCLCVALPAAAEPVLKKATLMPLWSPQAQFAGYYAALDKGIYRRHGIDLTILPGGPGRSSLEGLRSGRADFAVLWLTSAMQESARGLKVINLAQIVQRSSVMLIARKTSGIRTPADMQGKKVGLWGGEMALPAQVFLKKYRLRVREIPQSATVNLFLRGGIDVASAMWYNEYDTIVNSGINPDELQLFLLDDHGVTFPEDGLYALEKKYLKDPALAEAFVKASLEGWRYAFDHPDEALDIVLRQMKAANIPANRAHQKWMLARMRELLVPDEKAGQTGQLQPADFEAAGKALLGSGLVTSVPDFDAFRGRSHGGK